jgi:hypothetical protein
MYGAKHAGRACAVVFNEQMRQRLTRHRAGKRTAQDAGPGN